MKVFHTGNLFYLLIFLSFSFIFPAQDANAQRRDHLTVEEIEIVRDVQQIDMRIVVFAKAIERRFIVINGGTDNLDEKNKKKITKEEENWGELPKGTQAELLSDIDKILDEAISKIEDVAERDVESDLFPFAVHILADRAKLIIPRLEKLAVNNTNAREIALINSSIRHCNDIIEASAKIARPDEKQLAKRTKSI